MSSYFLAVFWGLWHFCLFVSIGSSRLSVGKWRFLLEAVVLFLFCEKRRAFRWPKLVKCLRETSGVWLRVNLGKVLFANFPEFFFKRYRGMLGELHSSVGSQELEFAKGLLVALLSNFVKLKKPVYLVQSQHFLMEEEGSILNMTHRSLQCRLWCRKAAPRLPTAVLSACWRSSSEAWFGMWRTTKIVWGSSSWTNPMLELSWL